VWLSDTENNKRLRKAIQETIHTTIDDDEDQADDIDDEAGAMDRPIEFPEPINIPRSILNDPRNGYLLEFRMDSMIFDYVARGIQQHYEEYRVIAEFDSGYLRIRTIPGSTHEILGEFVRDDIKNWANQSAPRGQDKPLMGMGSAGMLTDRVILSAANDQDYTWGIRRGSRGRKSPDLSFRPRDLTVPPARYQVRSSKPSDHYPTIVVELAHRNESWNRLVNDARRKAFARQTSIQVAIGIKIFRRDFRCFWAKRHRNGAGMTIVQRTPKLPLNAATNIVFTIPRDVFWWGIPAQGVPATATQDYDLSMDWLRQQINKCL